MNDIDRQEQDFSQNEEKEPKNNSEPTEVLDEILQLKNTIEELQKINENLKDQLLRKAADFDNYKKRIENDIINITRYANEDLIEKLLPILDDFERFLQHAQQENNPDNPFYKGIELIYNKFQKILELQGLKKIECIGQSFDVNLHDALMVIPTNDPSIPANTIVQEVEKGYMLYDKILRHAKVIVSGEAASVQNNNQEGGAD